VIVLTIILISIVVATAKGIRQKERNNKRQTDIKIIQGNLETYFNQNNKYPTLANLNSAAWLKSNLKSLNIQNLTDPKASHARLAASPRANAYSYEVSSSDGKPCDNIVTDCLKYTLTATYEGEGVYVKTNQL
jgi:type II secretory pathway pseudopilin PulG